MCLNSIERYLKNKIISIVIAILLVTEKKVSQIFNHLISHRRTLLISLFLSTIVLRTPSLYLSYENPHHDPGDDGCQFVVGGESIQEGKGYTTDYQLFFHPNSDDDLKSNLAYWYPPAFPYLIAGIYILNDASIGIHPFVAIEIANTILFAFSILTLFLISENIFGKKIALVSSILVMINFQLMRYSTSIVSETMYVFLSALSIYFLIGKDHYSENKKMIVLSGFLTGLVFLTRYPGFLVAISITLWFILVKKKYSNALLFGIIFFMTILPWFLLCYSVYQDPFPRIHATFAYPPAVMHSTSSSSAIPISHIINIGRIVKVLGSSLGSIEHLYFLAPFLIIGIIKYLKHKQLSLLSLLFIVICLFHITGEGGRAISRYILLIVFFGIPIGTNVMKDLLKSIKPIYFSKIEIDGKKLFVILISITIFFSGFYSIYESISRHSNEYNHDDEKYEWLQDYADEDAIICSTEPHRCNYFTGLKSIKLPTNLNEEWFEKFINRYNISHIVIEENSLVNYRTGYIHKIFYENEIKSISSEIYVGNLTLTLIHLETEYVNNMWFYKVYYHLG